MRYKYEWFASVGVTIHGSSKITRFTVDRPRRAQKISGRHHRENGSATRTVGLVVLIRAYKHNPHVRDFGAPMGHF